MAWQAFLCVLVPIVAVIGCFAAQIMFEVYLPGDTGARRCRSIVLLSLLALCLSGYDDAMLHGNLQCNLRDVLLFAIVVL